MNWKYPGETTRAGPSNVQLENARLRLVVANTLLLKPDVLMKLNCNEPPELSGLVRMIDDGSAKLNTVPMPALPPLFAVPYRTFPDRTKSVSGSAPSAPPVKLYKVVKPEPFVLTANRVPLLEVPPADVVPYRALPDKVKPAWGLAPPLPPVKLCRLVKTNPSMLTANTVPLPFVPPEYVVPYRVLPDKTNSENENDPSLLVPVIGSGAVK